MEETEYERLRDQYTRARRGADQARDAWAVFLPTRPGVEMPLTTPNIVQAYQDVIAAEAKESAARDALFAFLRPNNV